MREKSVRKCGKSVLIDIRARRGSVERADSGRTSTTVITLIVWTPYLGDIAMPPPSPAQVNPHMAWWVPS